jgi:hypothetical protein
MDINQVAAKVRARDPSSLLRSLAEGFAAGKSDLSATPLVTVQLAYGHLLEGKILRVESKGSDECVSMIVDLGRGSTGEKMAFFSLRQVLSVIIHQPIHFADLVSGGELARPPSGPVLSRLQLRREFENVSLGPTLAVDWDRIPPDDIAASNLKTLVAALAESSTSIRADDLGKRAWSQVKRLVIKHEAQAELAVRLADEVLTCSVDFLRALPAELRARVTALLNSVL